MSVLTGRYGCRVCRFLTAQLMQNVSGVGCDTAEELIRGAEQVGDGRQIIVAIAKPLAATQQRVSRDARGQWLSTYQTMPALRTQSGI